MARLFIFEIRTEEEAQYLLQKYFQAECLEWNGNKLGTNAVTDHFKSRDKFVVQFSGIRKNFVYAGIG